MEKLKCNFNIDWSDLTNRKQLDILSKVWEKVMQDFKLEVLGLSAGEFEDWFVKNIQPEVEKQVGNLLLEIEVRKGENEVNRG